MLMKSHATSIDDVNWDQWQPKDTVALTFIIKNNKILLINQLRGFG